MHNNESTKRAQARSLLTADHWGEPWSPGEIEIVQEFLDVPVEEVAETLGRTVYAVYNARLALARGLALGGGERRRRPQERAYTFIGDDCPPGWRD